MHLELEHIDVCFRWEVDGNSVDPNELSDHQIINCIGLLERQLESAMYDSEIDVESICQKKLELEGFWKIINGRKKAKKNPKKDIVLMFIDIESGEVIREVKTSKNRIDSIIKVV